MEKNYFRMSFKVNPEFPHVKANQDLNKHCNTDDWHRN